VDLLFNELSIHGQFPDVATFKISVGRVMRIRTVMRQFRLNLYCHRNVANRQVTQDKSLPQVIGTLDRNSRSALMVWLTQHGPFWEDVRKHGGDEYLEYEGEVVTDSAVGEAAYNRFHGIDQGVVSMDPSDWLSSPLTVTWVRDGQEPGVDVPNFWEADALKIALEAARAPLASWPDLEMTARARCPDLTFSQESFASLNGHPFNEGVAERLLRLFNVLHDLKNCFDEHGERTPEGHRLYATHFTGDEARFSDSSDTEKNDFRTALTFPHPERRSEPLFLYLARQGQDAPASDSFLVADTEGRAAVGDVRRAEDHQTVISHVDFARRLPRARWAATKRR